ncbi:MAG: PD-(D/E)XK nuclease family protein, partial [Gemmatimonadota bacterium]
WEAAQKALSKGELRFEATSQLTFEVLKGSDVAAASLPLVSDAEAIDFATHAAAIERDRRTGRVSPYNGRIDAPALRDWIAEKLGEDYVWSPTQLEHYAKCPWAWFSQRLLRLEHLDDPDIDIDPIARGSILHDAMKRFYELAQTKQQGPAFLRNDDMAWIPRFLEQVLEEAIAAAGPSAWLGIPALRRTKRDELLRMLRRFVDWEIEHNEDMFNRRKRASGILRTGVVEHELAFGMPTERSYDVAELMRDGVTFRVRGSVDRVERGIDERVPAEEREDFIAAVDYKTSKWSAPGGGDRKAWDDGVVLQVPLYAHVLERLRPGTRVARVEYRAFKQTGVQHSLELYRIEKKTGLTEQADAVGKMETALDDAGRHVARARTGEFPAHPAPSCACPPFCHAWDVCRVAMGPKSGMEASRDPEWKEKAAAIRGGAAVGTDEHAGPDGEEADG